MRSLLSKSQLQEMLLFAVIVLLAAFLRLYRLDQLPPGLHYDEAFKAVEARKVIAGNERPIIFRENLTEEPMMIYATAIAFTLFGESTWVLRWVSAMAGILTIAALYLLARALFQSRLAAALSAFTLVILYWHLNFSRLGMEPVLTPLTMALAFAFLWRAYRTGRAVGFVLAGVFLGATQYTYKAALFAPFLAAAVIGLEILLDREFWARQRRGLILFALAAVWVFAPLGLYFVSHPSEFVERPSTVTVAASGVMTLADNAIKVAGMFFVRGDDNPRSNLPGRPALDPFLAIGFIAGLIMCVVRIRRAESRFLLLWLVVMVLPSGLTDFAPHFGRSIGATPVIALMVAQGFGTLFERIRVPRRALAVVLLAGLAISAYSTVHDYFDVWGTRTGLFDSFDVGLLSLAQKLRDRPANEAIYLSPVDQDYYTVQFGLAGRDARSYDGRHVLVLPPPGTAVAYGIITRDDVRSLARLAKIFPNGRVVETIADFASKPYVSVFRAEDAPHIMPQKIVRARLGDAIELIGYDAARTGNTIALTVYWGSIAETREDYTVFVHLVGAFNPVTQSPVWAQDDARPGRGSYPTTRWQAGEVIVDDYRLVLPADVLGGEYQIEIGMYILKTGARVRLTDANGVPMENERVLLERISLP
jgi:4-amino-4-deoxy-L-arabinose transferase-like glycosyltransferase